MRGGKYIALQHRGLPDLVSDPGGGVEYVESGSVRTDRLRTREGSVIVAHRTRESFMRAVSKYHGRGDRDTHAPAPIPDGFSAAEARAGLRAIYAAATEKGE